MDPSCQPILWLGFGRRGDWSIFRPANVIYSRGVVRKHGPVPLPPAVGQQFVEFPSRRPCRWGHSLSFGLRLVKQRRRRGHCRTQSTALWHICWPDFKALFVDAIIEKARQSYVDLLLTVQEWRVADSTLCNAEGVQLHSPGSRSAPWVGKPKGPRTPKGCNRGGVAPLRGAETAWTPRPRVRCATLGFGV